VRVDPPPPPLTGGSVPPGVEVAVAWVWRLVVLGVGVVLLGLALGRVFLLTASFAGALLLTALLQPLAGRLHRAGMPARVSGAAVFLAFLAVVGAVVTTLGVVVAAQLPDVGRALSQGVDQVLSWLRSAGVSVDQQRLGSLRGRLASAQSSGQLLTGLLTAVGTLVDVVSGLLLALFVTLVLLLDGRRVWEWVLRLVPRGGRQPADGAGGEAWAALTAYMRGILVVALTDASLVAVALLLIGVPSVAPLAVLTFFGAFLPYVGAATAGLAAVVVALVSQGPTAALLTAGAVLAVQMLDGYVVEPLVLGKAVRLHPLAVVVVITLGGLLAGIGGAVVAVPLTAALNAAVVHLRHGGQAAAAAPG
jgi:predicted PurR-regulated permease PerM